MAGAIAPDPLQSQKSGDPGFISRRSFNPGGDHAEDGKAVAVHILRTAVSPSPPSDYAVPHLCAVKEGFVLTQHFNRLVDVSQKVMGWDMTPGHDHNPWLITFT